MTSDDLPARLVPPEPGAGGRSHWEVTPRGLAVVEELAGRGCHAATIARVLGMHSATFLDVRKRDPKVEEAYQRGLAREHDALVGNLRTLADDGNVVANLFLLKTRHGYREGEAAAVNVSVSTGGVVVLPPKMSMEEFLAQQQAAGMLDHMSDPELDEGSPAQRWVGGSDSKG